LRALCAVGLLAGCGGDKGPASTGGGPVETFTAHGISLTATTTTASDAKTTTVTKGGVAQMTMVFRTGGISLTFPNVNGKTELTFSTPLGHLPTDYGANLLASYIVAGQQTPAQSRPDSPGCDWFPDTQCTLGCCALHDNCYQENGCSAASWIPFLGSDACKNCNHVAASCIAAACASVVEATTNDRCYDNRCRMFYDCGAANCDCISPCDQISPDTCGNGSCEVTETVANCPNDCKDGAAVNQCCTATAGCPSETPDDCPGACCCCGLGEVCSYSTNLCAASR
jgi:hypothetical protein